MASLSHLFTNTPTHEANKPLGALSVFGHMDANSEYMKNFSVPFSGSDGGGILENSMANFIPNVDDSYRDISSTHDWRLGNGLGVSRAFRKPDSMPAHEGENPIHGRIIPTKNFGRSTVAPDLNNARDELRARARMAMPVMGSKRDEVPEQSMMREFDYNPQKIRADGSAYAAPVRGHQPRADASALHRRIYQPAPSRLTKMLSTDVEMAALRPQQTLHHPMKVVSEDRTREMEYRIPRNTDVTESVVYEGIHPRGMGSHVGGGKVWGRVDVLRQPVGNSDTGDKSALGRLSNPGPQSGNELLAETLDDALVKMKADHKYVRGYDIDEEMRWFRKGEEALYRQGITAPDPTGVGGSIHEFSRSASTANMPMASAKSSWPH